jgi:hypothetical protein
MADLGTDLYCVDDWDEMFPLVSERTCLIQAIARRFITTRGSLVEDLDYGFDLRSWLGESVGNLEFFQLQSGVEAECYKDERIESASAKLTFTPSANRIVIELRLTDGDGPFTLVVAIDEVSVEFLEAA